MSSNSEVVIIGAGVIGLTLGNLLLDSGKYQKVSIVAEHIGSSDHPEYTSSKAGANWMSVAEDKVHIEYDALTYKKFDYIVKNNITPHIKSAKIVETFTNADTFKLPWFSKLATNFKVLDKEELGDKYNFGYSYDSFIINSVSYLNWLKEDFTSKGGKLVQKKLSSLKESYQLFPNSKTFINCTGLGSKYLDDVKDPEVHPIRGQVVLIRAPHIKRCRLIHTGDDAKYCYMIPKGDGTVVLGGTKIKNDYSLQADPEISKKIIDRCVYYMEEDLKDLKLDIVKEYSASRPGRKSGVRLEASFTDQFNSRKERIVLHHLYGFAGFGFQASWGACQKLVENIDKFAEINKSKL